MIGSGRPPKVVKVQGSPIVSKGPGDQYSECIFPEPALYANPPGKPGPPLWDISLGRDKGIPGWRSRCGEWDQPLMNYFSTLTIQREETEAQVE